MVVDAFDAVKLDMLAWSVLEVEIVVEGLAIEAGADGVEAPENLVRVIGAVEPVDVISDEGAAEKGSVTGVLEDVTTREGVEDNMLGEEEPEDVEENKAPEGEEIEVVEEKAIGGDEDTSTGGEEAEDVVEYKSFEGEEAARCVFNGNRDEGRRRKEEELKFPVTNDEDEMEAVIDDKMDAKEDSDKFEYEIKGGTEEVVCVASDSVDETVACEVPKDSCDEEAEVRGGNETEKWLDVGKAALVVDDKVAISVGKNAFNDPSETRIVETEGLILGLMEKEGVGNSKE